jgi:hypothetical protein
VTALYTCGPAGGGGVRTGLRSALGTRVVPCRASARRGATSARWRSDRMHALDRAALRARPRPHRRQGQPLEHQRHRLAPGSGRCSSSRSPRRASRRSSRTAARPGDALPAAAAAGDELRLDDVLDGGVNDALNLDSHGKALAFLLLDLDVAVPEALRVHLPAPTLTAPFQSDRHGDRMTRSRHRLAAPSLAALLALRRAGAGAGKYPDKPITFVVPFAAAAPPTSWRARSAPRSPRDTKQAVVVDNKAGASGMMAAQAAARAPADGYTVLITTNTTHAANEHLYKKLPYDPVKDFVPVTGLGKGGQVLVVGRRAVQDVADLVAKAKKSRASSASAAAARRAASPARCSSSSAAPTSCTCRTRATRRR